MDIPDIPFNQIVDALLDGEVPFNPRYLYRLSDLEGQELQLLQSAWPRIPVRRRQALLEDLEELGDRDFVLSFAAVGRLALDDPDPFVRVGAVNLLWEYELPDLAYKYLDVIKNDSDSSVRAAAAGALGRYLHLGEIEELQKNVYQEIVAALLNLTQGNDVPVVRRKALEALGYSSHPQVPGLIENAYNSRDREWLASALYAMGRSANEAWAPQVLSMLDHSYALVRQEAARAAGELELQEAVESLLELLEDEDEDVRAASIWSLSQLGGDEARAKLEGMLDEAEDDEDVNFLEAAIDNLAFTEDMQLLPILDFPENGTENAADDDEDLFDFDIDEDDEDLSA